MELFTMKCEDGCREIHEDFAEFQRYFEKILSLYSEFVTYSKFYKYKKKKHNNNDERYYSIDIKKAIF